MRTGCVGMINPVKKAPAFGLGARPMVGRFRREPNICKAVAPTNLPMSGRRIVARTVVWLLSGRQLGTAPKISPASRAQTHHPEEFLSQYKITVSTPFQAGFTTSSIPANAPANMAPAAAS